MVESGPAAFGRASDDSGRLFMEAAIGVAD